LSYRLDPREVPQCQILVLVMVYKGREDLGFVDTDPRVGPSLSITVCFLWILVLVRRFRTPYVPLDPRVGPSLLITVCFLWILVLVRRF
jgi:hypothetical protein